MPARTVLLHVVPHPRASPGEVLAGLAHTGRHARRGEVLYRAGAPLRSIYAVRSGSFKSCVGLHDGRTQVTGFHTAGDVLGFDGLGNDLHTSEATALEDSEVGVVACSRLEEPGIQRQLRNALSRELVRNRAIMLLLRSMTGEERIATFLLDLLQRLAMRLGRPPDELHLRMTRAEIGSHLGLSLETVSRLFTRLEDKGLVAVRKRDLRMLDVPGLEALTSRHIPQRAPLRPWPRTVGIHSGAPMRADGHAS